MKKPLGLVVCGLAATLVLVTAAPSQAQLEVTKRLDITAFGGWRWGGNVNVTNPENNERINASFKAAASYGGIVDLNIYETWEGNVLLQFYFSQQGSKIQVRKGNEPRMEVADQDVRVYHGGIGYEWKLPGHFSPYILFTMGATQLAATTVPIDEANQVPGGPTERDVASNTRFSWGFAGGLKYEITPRFGIRGDLRSIATSTEIRDTGWACGYYSCGAVSFNQTIWQGDVTGGLYVAF